MLCGQEVIMDSVRVNEFGQMMIPSELTEKLGKEMRIMIDTNVIISAYLQPDSLTADVLNHIKNNHSIFLSKYIIDDVKNILTKPLIMNANEYKETFLFCG